ncbi:unnamed protein product [Sphagnum jensenii]
MPIHVYSFTVFHACNNGDHVRDHMKGMELDWIQEQVKAEQNHEKAVELYRLALRRGYSCAYEELGCCYALGRGVDRSDWKASIMLEKALERQTSAGTLLPYLLCESFSTNMLRFCETSSLNKWLESNTILDWWWNLGRAAGVLLFLMCSTFVAMRASLFLVLHFFSLFHSCTRAVLLFCMGNLSKSARFNKYELAYILNLCGGISSTLRKWQQIYYWLEE